MKSLAEHLGTVDPKAPDAPTVSYVEVSVKDFCKGVLTSQEYRDSIRIRILLGTLPPAVECRMYEYAYGKPPERVEHTGKDGQPIETITEVRRVIVRAGEAALAGELSEELEQQRRKAQVTH